MSSLVKFEARMQVAFEAEEYLIPISDWETCGAPSAALAVAMKATGEGYPTHGWLVLSSGGQGPCIDWWEKEASDPVGCDLARSTS